MSGLLGGSVEAHNGDEWVVFWEGEQLNLECVYVFFFLVRRRPPRSTQSRSSAASDVYKRQVERAAALGIGFRIVPQDLQRRDHAVPRGRTADPALSLIHISEPTRLLSSSYAVFCLKKKTLREPTSSYLFTKTKS